MDFLDRIDELDRLDSLMSSRDGGLAVLYGRRRVGKTRLLTEWCSRHGGLYTVADLSTADVQRRYLAEAVESVVPGFGEVEYRDWRGLFDRLARDAPAAGFRGPSERRVAPSTRLPIRSPGCGSESWRRIAVP